MKRLLLLALVLAAGLLVPFVLFGPVFESTFGRTDIAAWLQARAGWAWAPAIGLIVSDLVLPIPATAIMAALGIVYGPIGGGLIGAAGSVLAGGLAYALCRSLGRRAALRMVGADELDRGRGFFDRSGGWAVALSRWMPLLPEVIACLAGLTRMAPRRFFAALACGSLPMALTFATMGSAGSDHAWLPLTLSALLPIALWPVADRLLRRERNG